ncbi:MAG: alpha/beta fold hydrolase [Nitrosomonadales bacterium]
MTARNHIKENLSHAVVLLHGLCGTYVELGALIPKALKDNGYTVSSLEIPGYSASLIHPSVSPNWEEWCDTVDAELMRLKETHDTVSICGLSMGATLALAAAIRRDDILAVVLLSPILRYDGWAIPWGGILINIPLFLGFKKWSYKEKEPFGLRNIEMRRRVAMSLKEKGVAEIGAAAIPARQLYAAYKMMAYVRNSLGSIQSDILVIHAVDDETASPRNAEQILKEVNSEVRKAIWLGDCYHIITFDNEREIVTNETVRFIRKTIHNHENDQTYRQLTHRAALKDRR